MTVLFLAHGLPGTAFGENEISSVWAELGTTLPKPSSILIISAHWITTDTRITCGKKLATIHDFYAQPDEYYQFEYRAKGNPDLARDIQRKIKGMICDEDYGLDHGSWTILKHLYPQADVPILQLSLNSNYTFKEHIQLAQKLKFLKRQNVAIIGSGNIVHNRDRMHPSINHEPFCWATDFQERVKNLITEHNLKELMDLPFQTGQVGRLAVPSLDHYLPLLYICALKEKKGKLIFPIEKIEYGSISMLSFYCEN